MVSLRDASHAQDLRVDFWFKMRNSPRILADPDFLHRRLAPVIWPCLIPTDHSNILTSSRALTGAEASFSYELRLILTLLLLPLSQPDTRSAAVLVDELYAGGFESVPNDVKRRATRLA